MRFLFTSWLTCALSARQVCLHRRCNALCVVPKFAVWALWAEPSGLAASPPDEGFVQHGGARPSETRPLTHGAHRQLTAFHEQMAAHVGEDAARVRLYKLVRRSAMPPAYTEHSVMNSANGGAVAPVALYELRAQHFGNGNNNAACWRACGEQDLDQILEMFGEIACVSQDHKSLPLHMRQRPPPEHRTQFLKPSQQPSHGAPSTVASFTVTGASVSGAADPVHGLGGQLNLASAAAATPVAGTGAQGLGLLQFDHQHQQYQQHTPSILDIPSARPLHTPSQSAPLDPARFFAGLSHHVLSVIVEPDNLKLPRSPSAPREVGRTELTGSRARWRYFRFVPCHLKADVGKGGVKGREKKLDGRRASRNHSVVREESLQVNAPRE